MAVSRLFLDLQLSPVVPLICCMSFLRDYESVMCGMKSVLYAGFSVCHVSGLACAMYGISLCYVWLLACVM